ncbi:MAG: aminomethyl transferase family protein [Pyrinomonadaceae bacterium]|nr:aminomethyl transferase family protein [Pyrinomonadaceae bacterium]
MAEAVEQIVNRKSPLCDRHARLGGIMIERDGWQVPSSYGDVLLEYAAVREGSAGLIDLSPRGRILVSGTEAIQFLNGLITNDMKTLEVNTWMPAAFPNVQGRLIASVRVVRLQDEGTGKNVFPTFLLDTEAATHQSVLKTIERFTLAGDFRVTDITNQTALISVQGRKAASVVRAVLGDAASELDGNAARQWHVHAARDDHGRDARATSEYGELTAINASHAGEDRFDLIVNSNHAAGMWAALQDAGARPVGYEALEILRIEGGQPRYGVDMDEFNVVTEALDDAVSYTKGCYIGQEIIARIRYRGHVAKKLTGIVFPQAAKVEAGAVIKSADDKEIGRVTSAVYSPHLGRRVALAYLKYDYLAPETSVIVTSGDEKVPGKVAELPFVKGSPGQ